MQMLPQFGEDDRLQTGMFTPAGAQGATKTKAISKKKKAIVDGCSTERNYAINLRMSEWFPITDSKGPPNN